MMTLWSANGYGPCVKIICELRSKAAIVANAASIIVGHNHPSGDPTPSPEDVRITEMMADAGSLLDIDVLDHVIVGDGVGPYVSLKERRLSFL